MWWTPIGMKSLRRKFLYSMRMQLVVIFFLKYKFSLLNIRCEENTVRKGLKITIWISGILDRENIVSGGEKMGRMKKSSRLDHVIILT